MARFLKPALYITALVTLAVVFLSGFDTKKYKTVPKTHVVSAGQTVWGIATEYQLMQDKKMTIGEFVHKIYKANNIDPKAYIQPGDVLIIPLEVEQKEAL